MFNARVTSEGKIYIEYPSIPNKLDDGDIILLDIDNMELQQSILDNKLEIKIVNTETLEFETTIKEILPKQPTELELLQQRMELMQNALDDLILGGM